MASAPPQRSPGAVAQLVALLGGAVFYAAHLLAGPSLVPLACDADAPWLIHVLTLVAVLGIAVSAAVATRVWRRGRHGGDSLRTFVGGAGLLLAVLFAVTVLFAEVPALFLDPCL